MLALLLLQAVAGPPIPPELRKRTPRVATACATGPDASGEIVVCARPIDQRLAKRPEAAVAPRSDPMTFRLPGGGTGNIHAITSELPGARGQGVAVTLKIPFGKGKRK